MKLNDKFKTAGYVEVFVSKGKPLITKKDGKSFIDFSNAPLIEKIEGKNIVVNLAKDRLLDSLETGFMRIIGRMAIGDRGTIPSDPTVPKVPTVDKTSLYNEVYRPDIDQIIKTKVPGTSLIPSEYKIQFTPTFAALDVPISSMSNQTNPVVNEVALIMVDPIGGDPLPRGPVSAPGAHPADEEMFAMRAFKSVPFDQANELAITIRYTISIE